MLVIEIWPFFFYPRIMNAPFSLDEKNAAKGRAIRTLALLQLA